MWTREAIAALQHSSREGPHIATPLGIVSYCLIIT
jgi:hypothetical protein